MPRYSYKREVKVISKSELNSLLENCDKPQVRACIALAYYSGARISELLRLSLKSVRYEPEMSLYEITLRNLKRKDKSYRTLTLLRNLPYMSYFNDWWDNRYELYTKGKIGGAILFTRDRHSMNYYLKKAKIKAEIPLSWHAFRHSRLTEFAEKGYEAHQIRLWAGHKDIKSAVAYIEESARILRPMVEGLHD